jgi:hypothetical protein
MSRRIIQLGAIGFLMIGLVFTSGSAFAYWQDVTVSRTVEVVTIGEPVEITLSTVQSVDESLSLVPNGYAITEGLIEEALFIYEVGVSRELLTTVDLIISISNIYIGEDDTYSHLVDIEVMGQDDTATVDIENDLVTIYVVVKIIEPIDEEEAIEKGFDTSRVNVEDSVEAFYEIVGKEITFEVQFELQPKLEDSNNNFE